MKGGGRWRGRTERQRGGRATVVEKQAKAANVENTQSASQLQMPEQSPSKVLIEAKVSELQRKSVKVKREVQHHTVIIISPTKRVPDWEWVGG